MVASNFKILNIGTQLISSQFWRCLTATQADSKLVALPRKLSSTGRPWVQFVTVSLGNKTKLSEKLANDNSAKSTSAKLLRWVAKNNMASVSPQKGRKISQISSMYLSNMLSFFFQLQLTIFL